MNLPATPTSLYQYVELVMQAGFSRVAGVDEAGRGPLAGPVVVAAVVLPRDFQLPGLNDSKQVTARQRDLLFATLTTTPDVEIAHVVVSAAEVDRVNIYQATVEGMRQTTRQLAPDYALVDGRPVRDMPVPSQGIVKGDAKCASIAAASIIAKVTRDRLMEEYDRQYPDYGFAKHKGYGTKAHLAALQQHGPCPIHRRTFAPVAAVLPGALQQQPLPNLPKDAT